MGSPLTLTIANCYMFFFEQQIVKQVNNSGGLYVRYIDDIFIAINWPKQHLLKQIRRWNEFDSNIKLTAHSESTINFLDLEITIGDGQMSTKVYHKPSYEPYYLPFNSVHPLHMKKNIPYAMLYRAIKYCSTFQTFINERETIRTALLLNKYPSNFIEQQFIRLLQKFETEQKITIYNYNTIREKIINSPLEKNNEKLQIEYGKTLFIHFTYCENMKSFPKKFLTTWNKFFCESPLCDTKPILSTKNTNNLQLQLVKNKT